MHTPPRMLVGIMHSMEQEFDACLDAVRRQRGVSVEMFTIEGKAHQEAHRLLYGTFMEKANGYDVFVKVDADMVIQRDDFLLGLAAMYKARPGIDRLTVAVHDFFPDRLVSGLHTWRSRVRWPSVLDPVFPDGDPVPKDRVVTDYEELAPAAVHCPDPSPLQSFHYGVIRAVKVTAGMNQGWVNTYCYGLLEDTWRHFARTGDHRLALPCLGAEMALAGVFTDADLDYACPRVREQCARYERRSVQELGRKIRRLRALNGASRPLLALRAAGLRGLVGRFLA